MLLHHASPLPRLAWRNETCTSGGQSCDHWRTAGPGLVARAPRLAALTAEPSDLLTLAMLPDAAAAFRGLRDRPLLKEAVSRPDEHADVLRPAQRRQLRSGEARRAAEEELGRAERAGVRLVAFGEPDYPALLTRIYDPPPVLWVRGQPIDPGSSRGVAMVGSRAASAVGRELARRMAADLALAGASVISGFARGIDTAAHRGALEASGHTVAVLGSGVDRIYPAENEALVGRLLERGAIVSEQPLGSPPPARNFPLRNRIIAGWCHGLVVVEAAQRSGALITARCALEEGREVMAVPQHPGYRHGEGSNALIRDGARLVRDGADVALELGLELARSDAENASLPAWLPARVPATLDELKASSGLESGPLLGALGELEIRGEVRRLPGALYIRA